MLFDLGDLSVLENGTQKHFENDLKSMQFFQILMGGMNFREMLQKNQTSSVRSHKKLERKVKRLTLDLIHDFVCQIITQVFIVLGMYNFGALLSYRA